MGWTFYNANGQRLSSAATNISVLDIDGATDIGAAIVDADLFIIDDGAGGTNRKTAASRIVTYVAANAQAVQSAIEAETNEDTYVPPDLMRYARGIGKAWALWEQAGAHDFLQADPASAYNYTSLADGGGAGDTDHVIAIDFATAFYVTAGMPDSGFIRVGDSKTTGTFTTVTNTPGGTEADAGHNTVVVTGGFVD